MFDGQKGLSYNDYVCLCPLANIRHRKEFYMIKSMTGFGRAELVDEEKKITVEMKSVNHRYLDINMRMPKKLSFFEAAIRNLLKEYIQRGKVDLFITYEDYTQARVSVKYNREIAGQYLTYIQEMGREFGLDTEITAAALSKYPEVFTMEEQTPDEKELTLDSSGGSDPQGGRTVCREQDPGRCASKTGYPGKTEDYGQKGGSGGTQIS